MSSHKSFYILNPHRDDFIWEPLYFSFIKRRALKKYNYLADLYEESTHVKIAINDVCSGIIPQSILTLLPKGIRRWLIRIEFRKWKRLNNIKDNKDFVWLDNNLVVGKNDELFLFQLSNIIYIEKLRLTLQKFQSVYVHLSHYYLRPKEISAVFSTLINVHFCGDSDVSNHDFFKKYFSWNKNKFCITPFYVADRFNASTSFAERAKKIITTGTFHPIEEYPSSSYLHTELHVTAFHNNRRNVFENQINTTSFITCLNTPWKQSEAAWYVKLMSSVKVAQKKYFQINIVEEYNKHQFALIGEEICGFPGIGSFEAMACGCVVFLKPNTLVGILDNTNAYVSIDDNTEINEALINIDSAKLIDISNKAIDFVNTHLRKHHCLDGFKKQFKL